MITRQREKAIQQLARTKLIEHDSMQLPVRPIRFAEEKLGIIVQSFSPDEPDISGFLMLCGGKFGIGYSTAIANRGFQNFTVAHELGHYFIDGHTDALLSEGLHLSKSGFISADVYEREADVFATEFLMPWKLIAPLVDRSVQGYPAITAISENCGSSIVASAIRYTAVANEPVAVIVSYEGEVEFMTASADFKQIPGIEWLRRGQLLPPSVPSASYSDREDWILQCGFAEEGSLLSSWFPGAAAIEVEEDVVGLGNYGRLLTVLIANWELPEEDEEEEKEVDYIDRWQKGLFRGKNA